LAGEHEALALALQVVTQIDQHVRGRQRMSRSPWNFVTAIL